MSMTGTPIPMQKQNSYVSGQPKHEWYTVEDTVQFQFSDVKSNDLF